VRGPFWREGHQRHTWGRHESAKVEIDFAQEIVVAEIPAALLVLVVNLCTSITPIVGPCQHYDPDAHPLVLDLRLNLVSSTASHLNLNRLILLKEVAHSDWRDKLRVLERFRSSE
jgi:hypothetical protein